MADFLSLFGSFVASLPPALTSLVYMVVAVIVIGALIRVLK